ncbi:MAG TPA: signal recognition particle-docking protein FtsY [Gemmatimonadaceae bacterium]|nr:signal recognition particle-docking protein FtsY [Gemmatimonadaceae bacterium]
MRILRRKEDLPRRTLWRRIKDIALMDVGVLVRGGVSPGSLEKLEELLLESDFGVAVTIRLVAEVEGLASKGKVRTQEEFLQVLRDGIDSALRTGNSDPALTFAPSAPTVMLVVGVNGAGKTTFIAKLGARLRAEGKSVVVAAGDTYRAGAIDQLRVWAERTGTHFVGSAAGSDPAAVAFNAIESAVARHADVVIVDTAGRLHTQDNLMTELQKVARVVAKRLPGAPHETLLVLDGTIGQNAVAQARSFAQVVPLTGVVVTKLDGTARGGIVLAVHEALDIPIKFVGVGEQPEDLLPFDADAFSGGLVAGGW